MGVDATAAATEATEAGRATSTHPPPGSTRTPTSSRSVRHSPLSGHCGPGHLAAGSISGLRGSPCGQGGGEGRRGPRVVRYKEVWVRKEGEEGRPDRGRGTASRPGSGREERRGKGDGRESGGGNNVAGAAPVEFRFRKPPQRFDFGTSRRLPRTLDRGRRGSPRSTSRRLRRPQAGWGGRDRCPGDGPDGGAAGRSPRSDPTPARPPGRVRGGARARGRRWSQWRRPSSARPGLRWEEARRPGERKRGPDPPPAAARLREGAGPARRGAWAGGAAPPAGLRGHCGGVCPRPRPAPTCPLALKDPEGPSPRADQPALEQPPSLPRAQLPRCRSD